MATNLIGVLGTVAMIAAGPAMKQTAQAPQTSQAIQVEMKESSTMDRPKPC